MILFSKYPSVDLLIIFSKDKPHWLVDLFIMFSKDPSGSTYLFCMFSKDPSSSRTYYYAWNCYLQQH